MVAGAIHPMRRFCVAALLALLAASPARAEPAPLSIAEVRQISAVRQSRAAGHEAEVLAAAGKYLAKFPRGRYADEALLAYAEALATAKKFSEALAAYDKLATQFPDSPLRDQALVQSLPVLRTTGKLAEALARADRLLAETPQSFHAGRVLVWRAGALYAERDYDAALAALNAPGATTGLSEDEQTMHLRTLILATWHKGDKAGARKLFPRYLEREDAAEPKARVLLLAAADSLERGRAQEALDLYRRIIEQVPAPAVLPEARFRRAEVYAATLGETADDAGRARLQQAIAFYGECIEDVPNPYLAQALLGRSSVLLRAGRGPEALSDLDRASKLGGAHQGDPQWTRARIALLRQMGRDEEAGAVLDAALENTALPAQARLEFTLERAEFHYGRKACDLVEAALRPLPLFPELERRSRALFMRGFCALKQERWLPATADLELLAHESTYRELTVPPLLDAYEKSSQQARLVLLVEDLLGGGKLEPAAELMGRLAGAYEALGDPARILDVYRRLAKADPKAAAAPEARVRQARAEEALGRGAAAMVHYEAVLAGNAGDEAQPQAYLAALERIQVHYGRAGRFADLVAINDAAAKAALPPAELAKVRDARIEANQEWGRALRSQGRPAEASARLESAFALTTYADGPRRIEILLDLVSLDIQREQPEKGLRLVASEFAKAPAGQYRAALVSAILASYPDWGDQFIKGKDRDAAAQFLEGKLKGLPKARYSERLAAAVKLDVLYKAAGKFQERIALYGALGEGVEDESRRAEINTHLSDVYREFGEAEVRRKRPDAALKQFAQARSLAHPGDWRRQYPIVAAMGHLHVQRKEYTALVLAYEDVLPRIPDERMRAAVANYLGQIHLEWAREAEAESNSKSARIRYWRALDYLPPASTAERAGAAIRLSETLTKLGDAAAGAAMLAEQIKQLPAGAPRQEALLALGRARHEAGEDAAARQALAEADAGDNREASLEAGLMLAQLDVRAKRPEAAAARLEKLLERKPQPAELDTLIHYRLAVLRHQQGALKSALEHYRAAAAAKGSALKTYAKAVAQSSEQAAALDRYLKASGGETGAKIAVPKVSGDD